MTLTAAALSAPLVGCQQFQQPEPGPVEAADQNVTARFRILAVEQPSSELLKALNKYADVTHGDASAAANYDAVLIDADAIDDDAIADHAAVAAALQAGKLIIVVEPTQDHNAALIHELTGVSANQDCVALALDRVVDSDGRDHWSIVYGPMPVASKPGAAISAATLTAAYGDFAAAIHNYLATDEPSMNARLQPRPATAKAGNRSSDDNAPSLTAPAGALFRHVYAYVAPARTSNLPFTWGYDGETRWLDGNTFNQRVASLNGQFLSHAVKNHWYFYHNDPNGGGDFAGVDTYVIILKQEGQFSPGTLAWRSGTDVGWYQDHFDIRNTPGTWATADPKTFVARIMDLEDSSPENVNQSTSVTHSHETSISETLSVGISSDGINAGASITKTETFGDSTSRDISDWGIINGSDVGSGVTHWTFHQQMPDDRYANVDAPYDGNGNVKPLPALSLGTNQQDMITVWTTLGLSPDDDATGTYRLAFKTDVNHYFQGLTHAPMNLPLIGQIWRNLRFAGQLTSQQVWRVELNDKFLNGQ